MATQKKTLSFLVADELSPDPAHENVSAAAKQFAARLAAKLKASIDLVHVEDVVLLPVRAPEFKPMVERHYADRKAALASAAKALPVPANPVFVNGAPARKILSLASKRGAYELVALGTHGRKGLTRLVLGSVADEVIRNSRIPVLIAGPKTLGAVPRFLETSKPTILVPTDLSPNGKRAEAYAMTLAKRIGAEAVLFHCLQDGLHPVIQTAFALPDASRQLTGMLVEMKADAQKELSKRAAQFKKHGVTAHAVIDDRSLSASQATLNELKRSVASLIVMGTHGRGSMTAAFFGRTARDVILESTVPVITVHSRRG